MNETVIGRCSLCGGDVVVPTVFHSVVPPTPRCRSCGAVKANDGPVIPMKPVSYPPPGLWSTRPADETLRRRAGRPVY